MIVNINVIDLLKFLFESPSQFMATMVVFVFFGAFITHLIKSIIEKIGHTIATIILMIRNPLPTTVMEDIKKSLEKP
jgi:hypothetical protein